MNYSLGNIISNGGAINPDGLALDLAFAADKTLTARRGPTPTFSRASTATFVGSNGLIQSAAINAPRFDHDPVTLASRGLLIEEQRTNLCLQSQSPATAPWADISVDAGTGTATAINNTVVSPDGTTNGATLVLSARSASTRIQQISQFLTVSSILYTASIWVKATTVGDVGKIVNLWQGNGATAINVQTITLTNTWTRVSTVGSTNQIAGSRHVIIIGRLSTSFGGPSDLSPVSLDIWGAQVEAGSFPTSYIPTTTTALTRSADVCSITGADFTSFYNQSEGTMFVSGDARANPFATYVMSNINNNSSGVSIFRDSSQVTFAVAVSGAYTALISRSSTNGSFNKIAGSYALNDVRVSFNNVLGTPDTNALIPLNNVRFNIGSSMTGSSDIVNGCISSIQYFRKRLPNAKLQSLTA